MATVNLGLIKFRWQGAYAGGTAYVKDDVVSYNGSSYVCILASTGNLPTDTTYWNVMAQGGTDITSISGLAQGDILYYNGTDWVRLGAGTSGQVLQTGGTGANPSWTDQASGTVKQIKLFNRELTGDVSVGTGGTWIDTGMVLTITGTSASNYYVHRFHLNEPWGNTSSWHLNFRVWNVTDGAVVGNQQYIASIEGGGSHPQGVSVQGSIFESASTSAKQYKVQYANAGSNSAYVNWRGSAGYQNYSIEEVDGTLTTDAT